MAKKKTAELAADPCGVFDSGDRGIRNTPYNIRVALCKLKKKFSFDELANRVLINGEVIAGEHVLDDLLIKVVDEFEFEPKDRLWGRTIGETARRNSFHPIRDYLDNLEWDKEPRVDNWLCNYLGAADDEYTRAVGRLWLIAAVRRVRDPGCKFDEMLVLEGPQGSEKSSALQVLAVRDEFFTDDLPFREDSKVFIERCTGKWIVEFGELAGINKRDVEGIKATLSRRTDRARLAYDRITTEQPRTCVFAGSTNDAEYLRDMTGGRRFWPVRTGTIDLDGLRRDRDQLWAEAAHAEEAKESIRLDRSLWGAAAVEQESRRAPHPWEETLAAILEVVGEGTPVKVRSADVWLALELADVGRRTQQMNVDLGKVMVKLGFERAKAYFGGKSTHAYRRRDGEGNMVTVKWTLERDGAPGRWTVSTTVREPARGTLDDDIPF